MNVYLITYDLKKSGKDYKGLYNAIKGNEKWWHYLENAWLIATEESPASVQSSLLPHIDDNDNLLIIQVKRNYSGWLQQKAWDWMNENVTTT